VGLCPSNRLNPVSGGRGRKRREEKKEKKERILMTIRTRARVRSIRPRDWGFGGRRRRPAHERLKTRGWPRFASNEERMEPMNATLIEEYCDLVENGADFDGPRLEELRERMSRAEVAYVVNRLRGESEALHKEAEELRAEADRRRPTNDN
jgi:hypothetical protein